MNFTINFNSNPKTYLLITKNIKNLSKKTPPKYHTTKTLILYKKTPLIYPNKPTNNQNHYTSKTPYPIFNYPYLFYPKNKNKKYLTFNKTNNNKYKSKFQKIQTTNKTLFFNFTFPKQPKNTPNSINKHQFIPPIYPILTNKKKLTTKYSKNNYNKNKIYNYTYNIKLQSNKIYQFILTNLKKKKN